MISLQIGVFCELSRVSDPVLGLASQLMRNGELTNHEVVELAFLYNAFIESRLQEIGSFLVLILLLLVPLESDQKNTNEGIKIFDLLLDQPASTVKGLRENPQTPSRVFALPSTLVDELRLICLR